MIKLNERYTLSIKEASEYFGIGERKLRQLAEDHSDNGFAILNGNRYLIIREKFQEFLFETSAM